MEQFYTCINRFGNSILHRGYDENNQRVSRKINFKPTLYIPTNKTTGIKSIDGTELEERNFNSIKDAKRFIEQFQDIDNLKVYGNQNYLAQYIHSIHPETIKFDQKRINVTTIDIEVYSGDGFPNPEQAAYEVNAITIYSTTNETFYVWGLKEYDVSQSIVKDTNRIVYYQCESEAKLLASFIDHWHSEKYCPDVVTGWNSRSFDIPYLVNRITRILGEQFAKKLSPWNIIQQKSVKYKNKTIETYELYGIQHLDYLDIFQKFTTNTLGSQESYQLNHIASVVLGENKISYEEYSTLANLYNENHQLYLDYNLKDVQLVQRLDDKLGLIGLVMTMAYKAGVNYSDTMGTTAIWDSIIYRNLQLKNLVIPPSESKSKMGYAGAYVKDPHVGLHDWIVSFDLNSLYPSIIVQWNMSPETLVPGLLPLDVDKALNENLPEISKGTCLAANGSQFRIDKEGIIPSIIKEIYSERRMIKKKMLDCKQELEKANRSNKQEIYTIERDIAHYETEQMALKLLLNSLYGALGNPYFRYTNLTVAEAITLTGQMVIRWIERDINKQMNSILETDTDYVVAIDTDSNYLNCGPLVERFKPSNPIDFLDKACSDIFEPAIKESYERLFNLFNCKERRMEMSREVIADKGIWTAKKRYILNVYDNEGVRYTTPKLKITGIEAIKSSTPAICREALRELFKVIITGSESKTQEAIEEFREFFNSQPVENVSFPRGVSEIDKWVNSKTGYIKGTPINSRAAIIHNHNIKLKGLDKKYRLIQGGDKIKYTYLRTPNPVGENVIGFTNYLPSELKLEDYVDYEMQFEKTFLSPIRPIFDAIGWSMKSTQSLEDFFV